MSRAWIASRGGTLICQQAICHCRDLRPVVKTSVRFSRDFVNVEKFDDDYDQDKSLSRTAFVRVFVGNLKMQDYAFNMFELWYSANETNCNSMGS